MSRKSSGRSATTRRTSAGGGRVRVRLDSAAESESRPITWDCASKSVECRAGSRQPSAQGCSVRKSGIALARSPAHAHTDTHRRRTMATVTSAVRTSISQAFESLGLNGAKPAANGTAQVSSADAIALEHEYSAHKSVHTSTRHRPARLSCPRPATTVRNAGGELRLVLTRSRDAVETGRARAGTAQTGCWNVLLPSERHPSGRTGSRGGVRGRSRRGPGGRTRGTRNEHRWTRWRC